MERRKDLPPVAIFDADAPPALAFTRSLGSAGVPVVVYSHRRWPVSRWSRFASAYRPCPPLDEPDHFIGWLKERLRTGEIALIAPTSDVVAFYLAEIASLLPAYLERALPSRDATLNALLKDRFAAVCASLGVRTPRAFAPRSKSDACALAETLRYPVILKPRSHVAVGTVRGEVVHSPAELEARYRAYDIPPGHEAVIARMPELCWPIVQEYIPYALDNLYSVSGVIAPSGRVIGAAASRKIAQWPPALGVGTIFESCDDADLIERGTSIAGRILGRGLFELELIRDTRDGGYVAIDLNPRAYGQIRFELARGIDLPRLWYGCAIGEGEPETTTHVPPRDLLWVHSMPFHVGRIVTLMRGPDRARLGAEYLRLLRRPRVDIVNDARDPMPSVAFAAQMLRHPGGLLRPFLPESSRRAPIEAPVPAPASETLTSIKNAVKLGLSLIATWVIALGVRLLLPRYLGPDAFGGLQFADSFTTAFFVLASLGVETYVRKEVPTRVSHASDFFGGIVIVRLVMVALVTAAMALTLHWTHRSPQLQLLVYVFGMMQVVTTFNITFAALLHAVGAVDGLSLLNVASKVLWGAGIALGFALGSDVICVAWSLLFSELVKLVVSALLARRHLELRWRVDIAGTRAVVLASVPYFINLLALTVSSKLDVIFLELLTTPREVGWYGAASNVAGLALMLTPLMGWVLLPMSSRAAARSQDQLFALLHRALDTVLTIAVPSSLFLALGADVICAELFGDKFAPAAGSLRILAPMFVLTYLNMISATTLIRLERGWSVTWTSVVALLVNLALNSVLITPCYVHLGPGGGGIGAAISLIATEAVVTCLLLWHVGRQAFDQKNLRLIGRTALVCVAVCLFDALLSDWREVRLALDVALYTGLIIAVGAVQTHEVASVIRQVMKRQPVQNSGARNATNARPS